MTDLDTLAASQVLKKLHHQLHLLEQGGAGSATYYQLNQEKAAELVAERGDLNLKGGDLSCQSLNSSNTLEILQKLSDAIGTLSAMPKKKTFGLSF